MGIQAASFVLGNLWGMRLGPLPEFLGTNYYQIVYRAVVRLYDKAGNERPGVFFLRSDSNDAVMSYFGNRLTEFRFHYFHMGAIALFSPQASSSMFQVVPFFLSVQKNCLAEREM